MFTQHDGAQALALLAVGCVVQGPATRLGLTVTIADKGGRKN